MVLVVRAQKHYMQMVRIKKKKKKIITKQAPLLQKNQANRVCLKICWLSVWNTEHATLLKQLSSKVSGFLKQKVPKPVLLYCSLMHLIPSVTEVHGPGPASRSFTVRIDPSYVEKGQKDFTETLLWRAEVCRSPRHDDFRIWGVSFCHLKRCVSLSRGNITLGFKPEKVIGYVFSVSCNWWSDLLRGRINLPLSQKGLAENCLLGFLILFYPKCHVPLLVAEEILVVVESVKSW